MVKKVYYWKLNFFKHKKKMNYAIYSFAHTSTVNLALAIQNKLDIKDYAFNYLYHGLIFLPISYFYTKGQNKLKENLFDYFTPY